MGTTFKTTQQGPQVLVDTIHILYSGLGGHGSVVFSLLEASEEMQKRSMLVFYGVEPLIPEYIDKCKTMEIPYIHLQPKQGNPLKAWGRLFFIVSKKNIRYLFLNSVNAIIPVALAAKTRGKKLFVIEHMANALKTKFEKFCSSLAMRYADRVIVLTEVYRNDLEALLKNKFRPAKTLIIPNGIDTGKFVPGVKTNPGIAFGMVGRFTPSKDHKLLVQAFSELCKNFPNIYLRLAGDGETMPEIKALVNELGMGHAVILEGMLNEDAMVGFFHSLDIYTHISNGETMSTAIMQAMSCGLPILGSNVNGINNMVNEEVGMLVQNFKEEIRNAMQNLLEDPGARSTYGENARKFALTHFSSTAMSEKYLSLLR